MSTTRRKRVPTERWLAWYHRRRLTQTVRPGVEHLEARELMDVSLGLSAEWWQNTACQKAPAPVLTGDDDGGRSASPSNPTVHLTPGWATFGQALPEGAAYQGLRVGNLPTQTDVKTRWNDGSIKFAVVTAQVSVEGDYTLTDAPEMPGSFAPTIAPLALWFHINNEWYGSFVHPSFFYEDWLDGPLVKESREISTLYHWPTYQEHSFLHVLVDYRAYANGQTRVDIAVENTQDNPAATSVTYSVGLFNGSQPLSWHANVTQGYLTRWREVVGMGGLTESVVTPDFEPAQAAGALPRYLALVGNQVNVPYGPEFGILGGGDLNPYMPAHGGRPEIAPYPDWAARYLVHKDPTQGQFVKAHGDLAGSWPVHVRGLDYQMISIDRRPNFWLDPRAEPGQRPAGNLNATGPLTPDNAHQPSLAYIPYLVTGDHYYADEMSYWANYVLLSTWQDSFYNARQGAMGILEPNEVRGIAWGLRNLIDAASYLPDYDSMKWYFAEKIQNNLNWLDSYASGVTNPMGILWENKRLENSFPGYNDQAWVALWEHNYLAWAIDHANKQGFYGGLVHRDMITHLQVSLFADPALRDGAAPYVLPVGLQTPPGSMNINWYTTIGQMYQGTVQFAGYYGVDARLSLLSAIENGVPGAQEAYDYLNPFLAVDPFVDDMPDLGYRAGWAIAAGWEW